MMIHMAGRLKIIAERIRHCKTKWQFQQCMKETSFLIQANDLLEDAWNREMLVMFILNVSVLATIVVIAPQV